MIPINHLSNPKMKNLILSLAFAVICCSVFAQNKKGSATKTTPIKSTSTAPLKQEINWPVYYKNGKASDTFIIRPRPAVATKIRL